MLEQVGNAVKFVAFFTASKQGKAGISVTVDVRSPAGALIVNGAAASELGGGLYTYTLAGASTSAEGEYVAVFKTADTTVDFQHVPAMWVVGRAGVETLDANVSAVPGAVWDEFVAEHVIPGSTGEALLAAQAVSDPGAIAEAVWAEDVPSSYESGSAGAALGRLGGAEITVVGPVTSSGLVTLVQGDDYLAEDGRALVFTGGESWPDLTGATVQMSMRAGAQRVSVPGIGSGAQVTVELPSAITSTFSVRQYTYDIEATLAGGSIVTLVRGYVEVLAQVSAA